MTDAGSEVRSFVASDGYPLHVRSGRRSAVRAARSWCCTACRAMGAGIIGWGARSPRRDIRLVSRSPRFGCQRTRSRPHAVAAAAQPRPGRVAADGADRAPRAADRTGRASVGEASSR